MATGPIIIGSAGDIHQFAGDIVSDGKLNLTSGGSVGPVLLQQFQCSHGPVGLYYTKMVQSAALVGATANVGTDFIPANTMPLFISLYNTTLVTLAAGTTYTAGDGTTADLFGALLPLAVGDTGNKWKTLTSPKWYATATQLVLTGTGGAFTAGVVRAGMVYLQGGRLLS